MSYSGTLFGISIPGFNDDKMIYEFAIYLIAKILAGKKFSILKFLKLDG